MTGTPQGLPRLYTPAEVAEALQCSTWWVMEQVRNGRFPRCEVAGGYRFSAEQYAAIVRRLEVSPAEACPSASPARLAGTPSEASPGRLQARTPRRLQGVPSIDSAA